MIHTITTANRPIYASLIKALLAKMEWVGVLKVNMLLKCNMLLQKVLYFLLTSKWNYYHFINILEKGIATRPVGAICGTTCRTETVFCKPKTDCDGYCDYCDIESTCNILWEMDSKGNGLGRCRKVTLGINLKKAK